MQILWIFVTILTGVSHSRLAGLGYEYFKKLLNLECEIQIPHSVRRELEVRTITEEEVEKAVKKMKTGKAVGVDELSVEMVKTNRPLIWHLCSQAIAKLLMIGHSFV